MGISVKFWDLDYALKCVRGSEATADKLRKAELVRAIGALAWFVRGLPQGVTLLEEVRSLAGRVQDGLDKPGADYVDHPLRALQAQPEMVPYSYSASLMKAGAPRAGPPQPGHVAAYSFVPDEVLGAGGAGAARAARMTAAAAGEVAAAAAALAGDTQDQMETQGGDSGAGAGSGASGARTAVLAAAAVAAAEEAAAAAEAMAAAWKDSQDSLLYTQEDEDQPGLALFDPDRTPVIPAGQGSAAVSGGDRAEGVEKVSPPAPTNTDHSPAHYDVPIGAVNDDSMIASAGTGPLGAGGAVGRTTGQLQDQAGAQTQGTSAESKRPKKRTVCPAVRKGDVCEDKNCKKSHPAMCGDPLCFPSWRKDCQLWHFRVSQQGNGSSAGPGRAGRGQVQGLQQLQRQRQQQWRQRPQPPQRGQRPQRLQGPGPQRQQRQQQGQRQGWVRPPPPLFPPPPAPPNVWQRQQQQQLHPQPHGWHRLGWQHQQPQQGPPPQPTYSDVLKGNIGPAIDPLRQLLHRLAALEEGLARVQGSGSCPGM